MCLSAEHFGSTKFHYTVDEGVCIVCVLCVCRCVSELSIDSTTGKHLERVTLQDQNDPYHTKPVGKFLTSTQCHVLSRTNDPLPQQHILLL